VTKIVIREQIETMEASLRQVAGILSARIRADGDDISEVHVVAAPHRKAKGVVRDVITTLYARHGLHLHHHKVSVATTAADPSAAAEEAPVPRRLLFRSVNVYREGGRYEGQVELQDGERILTGTAGGPAVRSGSERLVAQAALRAVSRLFGDGLALELVGAERSRIGSRSVVLTHVVLLRHRSETHLVGSALVTSDPLEATVFSVLDALNRVLPVLAGGDTIEYEVEDLPPEIAS
jgi:hypothetical protein